LNVQAPEPGRNRWRACSALTLNFLPAVWGGAGRHRSRAAARWRACSVLTLNGFQLRVDWIKAIWNFSLACWEHDRRERGDVLDLPSLPTG
jgi:hypothetical protein